MKISTNILLVSAVLLVSVEARERLVAPGSFNFESKDAILDIHLSDKLHAKRDYHHSKSFSKCGFWSGVVSLANKISSVANDAASRVYEEVEVIWIDGKEKLDSVFSALTEVIDESTSPKFKTEVIANPSHKDQSVFKNQDQENFYMGELPQSGPTLLQTGINTIPEISFFAKYLRNNKIYDTRFSNSEKFTTIFAPTNEALMTLEKKPWEFPRKISKHHKNSMSEKSEKKLESIMNKNIKTFVNHHLITSLDSAYTSTFGPVDICGGSTVIISPSANNSPDQLYVHVVDTRGKTYSAKIVGEYSVHNGHIYVIDAPLSRP
ncbi:uncharacterized protein SAPINGB_P002614 [Magnusiomyces paraingens]|uniref:FAS1 domain-containing protein n=1 Tax=Magnusiomyces paraingens TaxID=2606893 RepID=A0A5E8BKL1_9ASCO|nr:uncharacterized protein SAPINGB_P002614 [Saprochaete ingens]VVT50127.1 unnamed protein product [Saprochaete ingens]